MQLCVPLFALPLALAAGHCASALDGAAQAVFDTGRDATPVHPSTAEANEVIKRLIAYTNGIENNPVFYADMILDSEAAQFWNTVESGMATLGAVAFVTSHFKDADPSVFREHVHSGRFMMSYYRFNMAAIASMGFEKSKEFGITFFVDMFHLHNLFYGVDQTHDSSAMHFVLLNLASTTCPEFVSHVIQNMHLSSCINVVSFAATTEGMSFKAPEIARRLQPEELLNAMSEFGDIGTNAQAMLGSVATSENFKPYVHAAIAANRTDIVAFMSLYVTEERTRTFDVPDPFILIVCLAQEYNRMPIERMAPFGNLRIVQILLQEKYKTRAIMYFERYVLNAPNMTVKSAIMSAWRCGSLMMLVAPNIANYFTPVQLFNVLLQRAADASDDGVVDEGYIETLAILDALYPDEALSKNAQANGKPYARQLKSFQKSDVWTMAVSNVTPRHSHTRHIKSPAGSQHMKP